MTIPTNRASFKEYCLRRLGKGAITINITDDQVDDRVDEAVSLFNEVHFEGSEKVYFKYILGTTDIANQYIPLPSNIIGAVNIFDLGDVYGMQNMFSIRYQIALNDLYTLTSVSMVPYYMALSHLQFLEQILIGKQPLRYNRYDNRLFIDMDWSQVMPNQYIIVEAYQVMNPDIMASCWQDIWLREYGTALLKLQWGQNLKKFQGVKMPDGTVINGQQIYNEAKDEIKELRYELTNTWSLPAADSIG